jgi:hypothetical protein
VEEALRALFFARPGPDGPVEFDFTCVADEHSSSLEASWAGQTETLEEAGGDLDANHPELRRVDIAVEVEETVPVSAGMSETRTLETATTDWAVKVGFVFTGGEGAYASGGFATLKNRRTGQEVDGGWIAGGGGAGVELPIPAVSPNPSWSNFRTSSPVTFRTFEGTAVRFTHVDVGIGVAGYSFAYIAFPFYMDEGVSVSGFVMNQWGIGGSVTSGVWDFTEPIPAPPTVVEEVEFPAEATVGSNFGHRVRFDTGSADVSGPEMEQLRAFVQGLP